MQTPTRVRTRRRVPEDLTVPPDSRSQLQTVTVPPPPTREEPSLYEEQQVTRVEDLMLRGVRTEGELLRLLSLQPHDRLKVQRWMKKARVRWEVLADSEDMRQARHRKIAETSYLLQEYWVQYQGAKDPREKIVLLGQIKDTLKFDAELNGLNKDTVIMLMNESGVPDNVLRSMAKQEELVEMMRMFAQLIREERENPSAGPAPRVVEAEVIDQGTSYKRETPQPPTGGEDDYRQAPPPPPMKRKLPPPRRERTDVDD